MSGGKSNKKKSSHQRKVSEKTIVMEPPFKPGLNYFMHIDFDLRKMESSSSMENKDLQKMESSSSMKNKDAEMGP